MCFVCFVWVLLHFRNTEHTKHIAIEISVFVASFLLFVFQLTRKWVLKQFINLANHRLKAPPNSAREAITLPLVQRFWSSDVTMCDEWQTAIIKILWKNEGSNERLTNCRGIVPQDVFARLTSAIVAARLSKLIKHVGIEEQFGSQSGCGTIDANCVLRALLQLRETHDKDAHALFVDLVKAFNTANHELLLKLLVQHGRKEPHWQR